MEGVSEELFEPFGGEHFDADDEEDECEGGFEVVELVDHAGEGEVEGAEAEDGEDVAGEDEEGIGGDGEDGGDGVDGEDEVGDFDEDECDEEWGDEPFSGGGVGDDGVGEGGCAGFGGFEGGVGACFDEEVLAVVVAGDGEVAADPTDDGVVFGVLFFFFHEEHFEGC